ncbi:MAG: hypothetical protein Q7V01_10535 [Vicinamibacterales bacterium]|nr:hypothetical protein [Vicinamibacterales bacterium]
MFVQDGAASASDLSRWLGPLSPAFTALAQNFTGDSLVRSPDPVRSPGAFAPGNGEPSGSGDPGAKAPGLRTEGGNGDAPGDPAPDLADLRSLFHTLNNQLGVILTYAELVEAKSPDDALRARATQIVSAAIDALNTSKEIRAVVIK